ncbi:hypothetical protein D3C84_717280 [compost metagenome]
MPSGGTVDQGMLFKLVERTRGCPAITEGRRADRNQVLLEQQCQWTLVQPVGQIQHIGIAVAAGVDQLAADGLD